MAVAVAVAVAVAAAVAAGKEGMVTIRRSVQHCEQSYARLSYSYRLWKKSSPRYLPSKARCMTGAQHSELPFNGVEARHHQATTTAASRLAVQWIGWRHGEKLGRGSGLGMMTCIGR